MDESPLERKGDPDFHGPTVPFSIDKLSVEGYRRFDERIEFGFGDVNVLVGINGSGKSSVLAAIKMCLSHFAHRFGGGSEELTIQEEERNRRASNSEVAVTVSSRQPLSEPGLRSFSWSVRVGHQYDMALPSPVQLVDLASRVFGHQHPIMVHFGVSRAASTPDLRETNRTYPAEAALENAFEASTNFAEFFSWFRNQEDIENEGKARGHLVSLPQLDAVRAAVATIVDGIGELRVRRAPLRGWSSASAIAEWRSSMCSNCRTASGPSSL